MKGERNLPLLVGEHIAPELLLLALNKLDVREHAIGFIALRKLG